ncbi:hypothetical protein [Chondromyces apiculatus]|uniref:Uncharacterized protein n=1 Tax=Chondromyces apiculatus DSM 436 TaxID=1192034 RepID=A0A017T1X2_9BACT|nr:hypothetical protein [Chondromyces apiculatus]EYF02850.1 Hypothetical protein CAP_6430 [Chondromyces apiculatus DSM 436]
MGKLTTAPEILQGLGLAPGFGSPLFGSSNRAEGVKSAPAVSAEAPLTNDANDALSVANRITALSFGAAAATLLLGWMLLPRRAKRREANPLGLARDIVLGATLTSGVASLIGSELRRRQPDDAHLLAGDTTKPALATSPVAQTAQRVLTTAGPVEIALAGAAVGITAVLALKSGQAPDRWSFLSRLLP